MERIVPEVRRLGRVVSNMLDLSRLERGVELATPVAGDIGEAVESCIERLRPTLEWAELDVDLKVEREYLDLIAPLPDTESEKKDETPEPEPEPGQNAEKKSIWALRGTAGVKNEGKDKPEPEPEDDELDGKLPVLS